MSNRHLQNSNPHVTPLYDDALPTSLKFEGFSSANQKGPRLHKATSNAPVSPYVIHLAGNKPLRSVSQQNRLEALANSLITDPDLLLDEEDLQENDDLSVDFLDLTEQLRQPSVHLNTSLSLQPVSRTPLTKHLPEQRASKPDFSRHVPTSFSIAFNTAAGVITTDEFLLTYKTLQEEVEILLTIVEIDEEAVESPAFILHAPENLFEQEPEPATRRFFHFAPARLRAAAVFVFLSFALVMPLHALERFGNLEHQQAEITDAGKAAVDHFLRGASALSEDRFDVAEYDFVKASEDFSVAESSLKQLNSSLVGLLAVVPQTEKTYSSVRNLTDAGASLAEAARIMAEAGAEISTSESTTIVSKLRIMQTYANAALPALETAEKALKGVDAQILPLEYQESITRMKETTPLIAGSMREFITFADTVILVLGDNREMRYLVTFQNNTELRGTGGFIGSFAEMNLLNGAISSVHVPPGGTYDLQGQLSNFVYSPQPLQLLSERWQFHDANWFPDFPQSSKKLLQFYSEAGGPTVDGVIAINASMMPQLLEILGPVDMPEYDRTITAENFLFETQKIVELEYDSYYQPEDREEAAPKQFIGDLAPIVLERIKNADMATMMAIADLLGQSLATKDVQLYFEHPSLQAQMEQLGWSGSVKQTSGDYLMVVNTNLGGGKTDTVINQFVDLDVHIADDGTVTNTVTIRKEHKGIKSTLFEGVNNVDYLRLYVPEGSTLLRASGFEIPPDALFEAKKTDLPLQEDRDLALSMQNIEKDTESGTDIWQEQGKTVFGNWIQTKPGETETAVFVYELPFKVDAAKTTETLLDRAKTKLGFRDLQTYTLLLQKQSGVLTRETSVSLKLPDDQSLVWSSHAGSLPGLDIVVPNATDAFLRFILERQTP